MTFLCVLGGSNDQAGNLDSISMERVQLCAERFSFERINNRASIILATGGFGGHFNRTGTPHNEYVRRGLTNLGVPDLGIITKGLESSNTVEDALLIKQYLGDKFEPSLHIITSSYHIKRVQLVFRAVLPDTEMLFVSPLTPVEVPPNLLEHEADSYNGMLARGYIYNGDERFPLQITF